MSSTDECNCDQALALQASLDVAEACIQQLEGRVAELERTQCTDSERAVLDASAWKANGTRHATGSDWYLKWLAGNSFDWIKGVAVAELALRAANSGFGSGEDISGVNSDLHSADPVDAELARRESAKCTPEE